VITFVSPSELHILDVSYRFIFYIHLPCNIKHDKSIKGASMVKYTTPLSSINLNESDTKLYTNFEFCEGKNHKQLKNTLIYKAKQFTLTRRISRKAYIFLEDNASSVQEGILNM
jgi:hypothetical protein